MVEGEDSVLLLLLLLLLLLCCRQTLHVVSVEVERR